jgi:hypothetical protein
VTNAIITTLFPGRTNYYAATTLISNGMESLYSNQTNSFVTDTNIYVYTTNYLPWYQPQYGPSLTGTNWAKFGAPFRSQFTNLARAYLRLWNYSNQVMGVTILTNPAPDALSSISRLTPPINK